jgi:hypothetical protein
MSNTGRLNSALRHSCIVFSIACACLFGHNRAQAQNITGTIVGTVADQTGAILPNVTVTIKNMSTGFVRTVVTDQHGDYTATLLPLGSYTVSIHPANFREAVGKLVLQVDETATLDFKAELSGTTQTVAVTAATPSLTDTSTSEVGQVIANSEVNNLPLNGREFEQLALLDSNASTQTSSNDATLQLEGPRIIMNGQGQENNRYTVDGTDATDIFYNILTFSPSIDVISEFKILTSNYSAEFDGFTGALVSVVTKSGSNEFHGDAYEFIRNSAIEAKNFFNPVATPIPPFRQNQFGATAGGPIKHDRVFFFGGYEGLRKSKALTSLVPVPTQAMRTGDLSAYVAGGQPAFVDPRTGLPFSGNMIPSGRIDSVATGFINLLPLPTSGQGQYFVLARPGTTTENQYNGRVDTQLAKKNRSFVRYSYDNLFLDSPGIVQLFDLHTVSTTNNLTIADTHIFRDNLLNEFRFGFNKTSGGQGLAQTGYNFPGMTGLQGVATDPAHIGVPVFVVSGFAASSGFAGNGVTYGQPQQLLVRPANQGGDNTIQFIDNVTFIRGAHSMKFGTQISRFWFNGGGDAFSRGSLTFNGKYTGNSYADLLLGLPFSGTVGVGNVQQHSRSYLFAFYGEDDWKVNRKLTLNLGLRWQYMAPLTEDEGGLSTLFLPSVSKNHPISNLSQYLNGGVTNPVFVGANTDPSKFPAGNLQNMVLPFVSAQSVGLPSSLIRPEKTNVAPRLGFAFAPFGNSNTVVRSGFGIFYTLPVAALVGNLKFNPPWLQLASVLNDGTRTSENIFLSSLGGNTSAYPVDPNTRIGYSEQWFLDLQQALTSTLLLDVSYDGNESKKLMGTNSINKPAPGPGAIGPRRPIPILGAFSWITSEGWNSNYNALHLRVEERNLAGLNLVGQYTFSKALGTGANWTGSANDQGPQDTLHPWTNYGPAGFDITHRIVGSALYSLPFGPGKTFGTNSSPFVGRLIEGWQANAITTFQTGFPFGISEAVDQANIGGGNRPDMVANPKLQKSQRTVQKYFNTSAFQVQALYKYGDTPRNAVRGPSMTDVDISFFKTTHIVENHEVELRAEFFNAFNHPNFATPGGQLGSSSFGQITTTIADSREIQFALKYIF